MEKRNCKTCTFSCPTTIYDARMSDKVIEAFQCRHSPPMLKENYEIGVWPVVFDESWCGRYLKEEGK